VFLGNCTTKPCWYERSAESSLLLSGTNHGCSQKQIDGLFWSVIIKFCNNEIIGIYKHYVTVVFKSVVVQRERQQMICWKSMVRIPPNASNPLWFHDMILFYILKKISFWKIYHMYSVGRTIYMWFSTQHITYVWTLSFYCICYNPTALGGYNTPTWN